MKRSILSLAIGTFLLSSCVTTKQFNLYKMDMEYKLEKLEKETDSKISNLELETNYKITNLESRNANKISNIDQNSQNDIEKIEQRMDTFEKAYNKDMHTMLNRNLELSKNHSRNIKTILNDVSKLKNQTVDLVDQSNKNAKIVSNNASTSTTQNVVNEFNLLEKTWQNTLSRMNQITDKLQIISDNADRSAQIAQDKAISADNRASNAEQRLAEIEDYSNVLFDLRQEVFQIGYTLEQEQLQATKREDNLIKYQNEQKRINKNIFSKPIDQYSNNKNEIQSSIDLNKSFIEIYNELSKNIRNLEIKINQLNRKVSIDLNKNDLDQ